MCLGAIVLAARGLPPELIETFLSAYVRRERVELEAADAGSSTDD